MLEIIGSLFHTTQKEVESGCVARPGCTERGYKIGRFVKLFTFYLFCMIGSRTERTSRLGEALLSVDKEESCYHMCVCVFG